MSRIKTDSENIVQSACADALVAYFDRKDITYRQLWTYANQQGKSANQFCADLVGTINSSALLLMEFKSLDHITGELQSFDEEQYAVAKAMQGENIPLVYCYDNVQPLPYYYEPRPQSWPTAVLMAINAAVPDDLDGIVPRRSAHGNLLDWINTRVGEQPTNLIQAFGTALGGLLPNMARNKLISVLYSEQQNQAMMLNEQGLLQFSVWLAKLKPNSDTIFQSRIAALRESLNAKLALAPPNNAQSRRLSAAKKTPWRKGGSRD